MNVKIMGFEWGFNSKISPTDLLNKISEIERQRLTEIQDSFERDIEFEDSNIKNMICVRKQGNFWYGIFVRFTSRAAFMKLLKSNDGLRIGSQDLQRNEKISEVNFFLFDEEKKKGVYTYHYQSTWIDTFNKYVKLLYENIIAERIREIDNLIKNKSITKSEGKREKKQYTPLKIYIVTSQAGFENLMNEMRVIDKVSFSFKAKSISDDGYSPLREYARSQKVEIGISSHNATQNKIAVISNIMSQATRDCIKTITVYGKSSKELSLPDLVAKIHKNYEYYAKKDYLEIYRGINIDFQNLDDTLNKDTHVFIWLNSVIERI